MDLIRNFIGGNWQAAASGRTQDNLNPASGAVLGKVVASGVDEVTAAVSAAKAALPEWRSMPAPRRGEILFRARRHPDAAARRSWRAR